MNILSQTYRDWQLVVVNDGGDPARAHRALTPFRLDFGERSLLLHQPKRLTGGAVFNLAIRASESDYIAVYDERSSWHPSFLGEMIDYLKLPSHRDYGGVVCETRTLDLVFRPAPGHYCFPPISFLFKRSVAESCGLFDPEMDGLTDWEFNSRFLAASEVGLLKKPLAYSCF
jgi:glycosyltransferase involved in cell wall biosynthesis